MVRFPNGATTNIDVTKVTAADALIRTSDGNMWRVEKVSPKELAFPPPGAAGAPTTYWQVKERASAQE